jgi:hypothetical protein
MNQTLGSAPWRPPACAALTGDQQSSNSQAARSRTEWRGWVLLEGGNSRTETTEPNPPMHVSNKSSNASTSNRATYSLISAWYGAKSAGVDSWTALFSFLSYSVLILLFLPHHTLSYLWRVTPWLQGYEDANALSIGGTALLGLGMSKQTCGQWPVQKQPIDVKIEKSWRHWCH